MKVKVAFLIDLSSLTPRAQSCQGSTDVKAIVKTDLDTTVTDHEDSVIIGSDVSHVDESNTSYTTTIESTTDRTILNSPAPDSTYTLDFAHIQNYILERLTKDGTSISSSTSTTTRSFDITNYEWTYRFYRSSTHRPGSGQIFGKWGKKFEPFDYSSWIKFEEDFKEQVEQNQGLGPEDDFVQPAPGHGISQLSTGLKNLISDLDWKDEQSSIRSDEDINTTVTKRNLIYALFQIPRTEDELLDFAGTLKEVSNSKSFLDALLPKAFYKQCRETMGIRVHWVDTGATSLCPEVGYPKPLPKVLHYLGSGGTGILQAATQAKVNDHDLPDWGWFLRANLEAATSKTSKANNSKRNRLSDEGNSSQSQQPISFSSQGSNSNSTMKSQNFFQDPNRTNLSNSISNTKKLQQRLIGSISGSGGSLMNRSRISLNSSSISHLSASSGSRSQTKSFLDVQNSRRPILVPTKSSGSGKSRSGTNSLKRGDSVTHTFNSGLSKPNSRNLNSSSFHSSSNSSMFTFASSSSLGSNNSPKRVRRNLFNSSEIRLPDKRQSAFTFFKSSGVGSGAPLSPTLGPHGQANHHHHLRSPRIGGLANSEMFSPAGSTASSSTFLSPRFLLSPSPNEKNPYKDLSSGTLFGFPSPTQPPPKAKRRLQLDHHPSLSSISIVENSGTIDSSVSQSRRLLGPKDDKIFKKPAPSPGPAYKLGGSAAASFFNQIVCPASPATPPSKRRNEIVSPDGSISAYPPSSCEKREIVAESPESLATTTNRQGNRPGFGRYDSSYRFYSNQSTSSSRAWKTSGQKLQAARIKESVDLSNSNLSFSDIELLPDSPILLK